MPGRKAVGWRASPGAAGRGCTLAIPRCRLVAHHGALTPCVCSQNSGRQSFKPVPPRCKACSCDAVCLCSEKSQGYSLASRTVAFSFRKKYFVFILLGRMMIWQHPAVVII